MSSSAATPAPYPHLLAPLGLGFTAHRMGGTLEAGELDAKRAIDQAARL
ncbi:hypothetical protein [Acidovorax soli]|uniref:Uncharacterized protein n=1 Tax=Acidovorax soli TaxID=592050 RepID=A0A1H4A7C6_9BURK|nr:hypothetical protein [Acidovorax soli]SEA31482.1 hypothetical protein SAMN05421875_109111 [Acidovorax soli]